MEATCACRTGEGRAPARLAAAPAARIVSIAVRIEVRLITSSPFRVVSANERHPRALMLVTLARLGQDEGVRAVRVRDQRRGFVRRRRPSLAADDIGEAACRCDLVVVTLERAVARERVVVGVRGDAVDLEGRGEGAAAVCRLLS